MKLARGAAAVVHARSQGKKPVEVPLTGHVCVVLDEAVLDCDEIHRVIVGPKDRPHWMDWAWVANLRISIWAFGKDKERVIELANAIKRNGCAVLELVNIDRLSEPGYNGEKYGA